MRQLNVDPEFRDKIPPLSADEFSKLEENIVTDGEVREPLVVWHNTIIDGHHRYKIVQKHPEIPFKVKQMDFPDKWAAIVWMCRNQLGRRNITREQRDYLLSQEYEAQCKTVGGDGSNQYEKKEQLDENHQIAKGDTRAAIAKSHNISQYEVQKAVEFGRGLDAAEKVSPGIKEAVLSGSVKAPKSVISEIRNAPEEKKREAVEAIKKGDTDTAKAILRPIPKVEPEEPPAPFTVSEFQELIHTAIKALDASLKQHMVLVHREMLDIPSGRDAAMKELDRGIEVIEKYKNMIRMVSENTVGRIDVEKYKVVTDKIQTDEVIITDERIEHIRERHPNDFELYSQYLKQIVEEPDYILEANKPNTAFLLKEFLEDDERFQLILRLAVEGDIPGYKNSIITFLKVEEKRYRRYLRTKKILYKSE